MQISLTRWALMAMAVSLVVLLGLSTFLGGGSRFLVGSAEKGPSTEPPAEKSVQGSIPSQGQPGVSSESPNAALMIEVDLDDDSIEPLLATLEKQEFSATFFVVGADVARAKDALQQITDAGHELGLGSFNQSLIGDLSPSDQIAQYRLTQRLIEGAIGQSPILIHLPYSSDAQSLPPAEFQAAQNLQDAGFITVFADDVLTDGAESIDLTGDNKTILVTEQRSSEAFADLLVALEEEQYSLSTLSEYGGVENNGRTSFFRLVQSKALFWAAGFQRFFAAVLAASLLVLGMFLITQHLVGLVLVVRRRLLGSTKAEAKTVYTPPVSIIIAACNADQELKNTLVSIHRSDYAGTVEILVVDDGSNDKTAWVARQVAGVRVLSQNYSGRAIAVNEGIRNASHDICFLTTPDAEFDSDTISRLVAPLSDPTVALVSGYAINRGKSVLGDLINIEKVSQFYTYQRLEVALGLASDMSNTLSAFRRSAVVDIGGVTNMTSAANRDLTVSLGVRGWNFDRASDAPVSVAGENTIRRLWCDLLDQRYGMLQVVWKHRRNHPGGNNSRYRVPALSYALVTEFIVPLMAPLIDVFVLIKLLSDGGGLLVTVWYSAIALQIFSTWVAVFASKARDELLLYSIPQLFFFRYLHALVAARALFLVVDGRGADNPAKVETEPVSDARVPVPTMARR